MRIGVLGTLQVRDSAGQPVRLAGPVRSRLLAALLCRGGGLVSVDRLIDDLWGPLPPPSAAKTLQSHIVRLRNDLGRGAGPTIRTHRTGYSIDVAPDDLDALVFERLASPGNGPLADSAERLDRALELWRGDAYVDFGDAAFAVGERLRLAELRSLALERRTDLLLEMGMAAEVIPELDGRVLVEPYRERGWEQLIIALYRCGRQAEALAAYRRVSDLLAADLGVDPGKALRNLEGRVLRQDESLLGPLVLESDGVPFAVSRQRCPYRGLAHYRDQDAALFVGREHVLTRLASLLDHQPGLVITGPSGSGKTSLIHAGLLPTLRAGAIPGSSAWRAAVVNPRQARVATGELQLLVVDQAEELFTLMDEGERESVAQHLRARLAEGCRLVLSLRDDYFGRVAELGPLAELSRATMLVRPMRDDEIRRAVVEPARRCGCRVDPDLVEAVLDDISGQPGALPLLSVALVRTWENRADDALTLTGYRDGGGIARALETSAEESFLSLPCDLQPAGRRLLLRLVSWQGDGWVRRPMALGDRGAADDSDALAALLAGRLVTITGDRVELVHDALLTGWPRLRGWLDERARAAEVLENLSRAAGAWEHAGEQPTDLFRGARLQSVLDWAQERPEDLGALETRFVSASVAEAETELRTERDRADREAAGRRRLGVALVGLVVLLVLVLTAGIVAVVERNQSRQQAQRAEAEALTADAGLLAAESTAAPDLRTRLLLAVAAYRLEDTTDTRSALLTALEQNGSAAYRISTANRLLWLGVDKSGTRIFAADNQNTVLCFDVATRKLIHSYPFDGDYVAAMSPDGSTLVISGGSRGPGTLTVVDANTGATVSRLGGYRYGAVAGFSGNGRYLLVVGADPKAGRAGAADSIDVFDTRSWGTPRVASVGAPIAAQATGDSSFAVATRSGQLVVMDTATLRLLHRGVPARPLASAIEHGAAQLALSPRGDKAAIVEGEPSQVGIVNTSMMRHTVWARLTDDAWQSPAFSPSGDLLAMGGQGGGVAVVSTVTGDPTVDLAGDNGPVLGVAWAGNPGPERPGLQLFTDGLDSQIVSWDLSPTARMLSLHGPPEPAGLDFTFPGLQLGFEPFAFDGPATPRQESLEAENLSTGGLRTWPLHLRRGESITSVTPDRVDDRVLVTVDGPSDRRRIELWSLAAGRELESKALPRASTQVGGGAIAGDGTLAAIATGRNTITMYRLPSLTPVRTLTIHLRAPNAGRVYMSPQLFLPDGRLMVSGNDPGPPPHAPGSAPKANTLLAEVSQMTGAVDGEIGLGVEGMLGPLSWSPDRTKILAGTLGGELWLLRASDLHPLVANVPAVSGFVLSAAFSPDGSMVVASGTDGTLSFFDATSLHRIGNPIPMPYADWTFGAYARHREEVVGMAPVHGGEQRVFTFPGSPETWARVACRIAGSDLTHAEWRRYAGSEPYHRVCQGG